MERVRFVIRRLRAADLSVGAAAVAYNAFLAMVPLSLAVVGVAAMFGDDAAAVARVEAALYPIAPEAVVTFVTSLMTDTAGRVGDGGVVLVVVSLLISLFLGSRAVVALQRSLAVVAGGSEIRPPLQMRLVGLALTVAGGLALVVTSVALVAGGALFAFLARLAGWEPIERLGTLLGLPLAAAGVFGFLMLFYVFGPSIPVPRAGVAALVGVVGIVGGSLGFSLYLALAPGLGATFGTLGAVAVALVWLYLGALSVLAGAVVAYALVDASTR
ncbi:MAG: YihY/virulence factor BrkB family protein [Acidimicrobiia bacterium]